MKILFYTNVPSPYRVSFFNELGKHCDLTVLFETGSSTERDDTWKDYKFEFFRGIILKGIRTAVDSAFCPEIIKYLKKDTYDHIVVTQVASYTAIWAAVYMRMRNIPYCYEGDGGFVSSITGLKARLKRLVIGGAEYCFSTSELFDDYCRAYGAKNGKIYRYPLTSIEEKDVLPKPLTRVEKELYKKELGMTEEYILLSVGQFIYRKGFDILLQAVKELPENVGIYIAGGTPTAEFLEMKAKWNLERVYFVDFMKKDKLSKYYRAANIFVFPTREDIWGLVVNEAMAHGLPVISTNRCISALEMVDSGEEGYIVPVNDVNALKSAIVKILETNELRDHMAEKALKKMKMKYTIENMAQEHMEVFKKETR